MMHALFNELFMKIEYSTQIVQCGNEALIVIDVVIIVINEISQYIVRLSLQQTVDLMGIKRSCTAELMTCNVYI